MTGTEPDLAPGSPHPRLTPVLAGQAPAEESFLTAWQTRRLHHAWLLHGPRGVGKATLAYRIARFLFTDPGRDAGTLAVREAHPVARRVAAGGEERLHVVRRSPDGAVRTAAAKSRPARFIRVDDMRALRHFFHHSPISGGWRVAIVDTADDMNENAANALLKLLEEPPPRCLLLLACHAPWRLPRTIISRCRRLRLAALDEAAFRAALQRAAPSLQGSELRLLHAASDGSPGEALRMRALGGVELRRELDTLLADLPELDRRRLATFTTSLVGAGNEARRELAARMLQRSLVDLARVAAEGKGRDPSRTGLPRRLAPLAGSLAQGRVWADAASTLGDTLDQSALVNLDPAASFLAALLQLEQAARVAGRPTG